MAPPRHGARPVTATIGNRTRSGGRSTLGCAPAATPAGARLPRRGDPDEVRARLSEHIPLRRYGEPEEFGWAAAFVLSPAASHITGAMIPVDGGAIRSI
jgi:NAD(P)-dependent dehydrogenase (short-subunit alcohol dehydrogenase family)